MSCAPERFYLELAFKSPALEFPAFHTSSVAKFLLSEMQCNQLDMMCDAAALQSSRKAEIHRTM